MTQAPYQQGYQPQAPQQQQGYQPQQPQGQAPWQQPGPQQGGYQSQQPAPQQSYQPTGQPGPVQGTPQGQQQSQQTMQAYQPGEDGSDPMLEDFTVFRGAAPYLSFSDPQCTGYERGGTVLAVGTDFARKFKTNEPLFWEYGPKKGQQRMCRVLILQTQERIPGRQDDTGIRTLELMDGKDIFKAAAMAVRTVSPNKPAFEVGGQLFITRTGTRQSQGGQPAVTYAARYVPAPADYVASDQNLMAQNLLEGQQDQQAAPSNGAQQVQQAAAYVASTPQGQQPQYQPAPAQQGYQQPQGQAPWQNQQPAPAAAQGQAPWQTQPQQTPPWQNQGPTQQPQQAAPPWQAQGPQPQNGHPFGPSTQQPMQSPYPPQQQG